MSLMRVHLFKPSIILAASLVLIIAGQAFAQNVGSYTFAAMSPRDAYDRPAPFTDCEIWGWTHVNDGMFFYCMPKFHGPVTISTGEFVDLGGNPPDFDIQPESGAPTLNLLEQATALRNGASVNISDASNWHRPEGYPSFMTWIKFRGNAGVDVFQYYMGGAPAESLVFHMGPPNWVGIFVDGAVRIEGTVSGQVTIGASQDIYLVDDLRYSDAGAHGEFDEASEHSMLGVISEKNIIIANTRPNGRNNSSGEGNNAPMNRSSIVLDGAFVALGGSFTFEDQNEDWELFQGPTPDDRGWIWLKGSIIQRYKGRLHTSNHQSTGYGLSAHPDARFEDRPPPFMPESIAGLRGAYGKMVLRQYSIILGNTTIDTLIILPPNHNWQGYNRSGLSFMDGTTLTVRRLLQVEGLANDPSYIGIEQSDMGGRARLQCFSDSSTEVFINGCIFGADVSLEVWGDTTRIANSTFAEEVNIHGSVLLDSCEFDKRLNLHAGDRASLHRSLILGGVELTGEWQAVKIANNTFDGYGFGVRMERGSGVTLLNNIINRASPGIICDGWGEPDLRYNCVFPGGSAYRGCSPGEGSISDDPKFSLDRQTPYDLRRNSPCIDAGDPTSPRDPDGTRADMGSNYFSHRLDVSDPNFQLSTFNLQLSPNPFNEVTRIQIQTTKTLRLEVGVYDVGGRLKRVLFDGEVEVGRKEMVLDAKGWPAGVYLVRVQMGREVKVMMVVKVN